MSSSASAHRAQAAVAIEESAEELYEQAPCGHMSTLLDGTIVRVNETLVGWTGRSRSELLAGVRFQELLGAGGRLFFDTHLGPLMQMQGRIDEIALEILCKDRPPLPVLVNAVHKRDAHGTPQLMRITLFNATERRRYERELLHARRRAERLEERLRLIAQSSSLGTFDWNPAADVLDLSVQARRMFGLPDTAGPVGLSTLMAAVHPQDRAPVVDAIDRAQQPNGAGECRVQCRVVWPDGTVRWLDVIGQAQLEGIGTQRRAVRLAGVLWDVTEQQALMASLRDVDRRKDEFLAMLAHELRNPLAPIRNALRILAHESLTPRGLDALELSDRQLRQMVRLVDDLLEVSRIRSGKIGLRRERVAVDAIVRQVAQAVGSTLQARTQQLALNLPPDAVWIDADPTRLAQIVENLLTNASKYSGDEGAIAVTVAQDTDGVTIDVVDDGIGIEPDKLPRLFSLFSQIDATIDRAQGGLGIGLALVKQLAELHGGAVRAHSAGKDQGARFTVRLPRTAARR